MTTTLPPLSSSSFEQTQPTETSDVNGRALDTVHNSGNTLINTRTAPEDSNNDPTLSIAQNLFIKHGLPKKLFINQSLRTPSLLYMIYWTNRLRNNPQECDAIKDHLSNYVSSKAGSWGLDDFIARTQRQSHLTQKISNHQKSMATRHNTKALPTQPPSDYDQLLLLSEQYVKHSLVPVQTVDLVIEKDSAIDSGKKEVLLFERPVFPKGICLPGGLVEDSDEDNSLGIDAKTFAALRVAAEKVLYLDKNDRVYQFNERPDDSAAYSVSNKSGTKKIILHPKNIYGYSIKENIRSVIRPSDPRHIVDTVGFKCELIDNTNAQAHEYFWESKQNLLSNNLTHGHNHFAFNHHKEIILHTLAKTSVQSDMAFDETSFIKKLIDNPLGSYQALKERFENNRFNTNTSMPELFSTVNQTLEKLFSKDINALCESHSIFTGFRDKAVNSLRHVSLKNRTFCPYLPTVQAIFCAIAFFDTVERHKKDFYKDVNPQTILEHDPKIKAHAAYHMYKYQYRMNELMSRIPDELVIPTFTSTSATDLMKLRGVPIRIVGLCEHFLYVDEFEQSPEEFLMHDLNHSYRMMIEDDKYLAAHPELNKEDFYKAQNKFMKPYLASIKILSTDDEQTKEFKKIKKIILFEVLHEDAKPFLPDVVLSALIKKEGGETQFELPVIDPKTHYLDIVDVLDTEISTLAYVRSKLQCGFYDKVDKQNAQIVSPQYRKSHFIAQAAMEMVRDLSKMLNLSVNVDQDYLLKRVCSVGPNSIHEPIDKDENLITHSDGAEYLNPKRYKSNQVGI